MICALLGAGTIGFGVVEIADGTKGITIKKVLDKRIIPEIEDRLTADIDDIFSDDGIDTVIELLGGVEPAGGWALKALESGRNVVTANKLMLSERLDKLLAAGKKSGASLRFSAAVGGGIPYLFNLLRSRRIDEITEIGGILNGTTNYILSSMADRGLGFDEALAGAQAKGYSEANPHMDISGEDARCKLMLSACIAFNALMDKADVLCKGIEEITAADIAQARSMGKTIKLFARARKLGDCVSCCVEPTLTDALSVEGNVSGVENMAYFIGKHAGLQRYTGEGAGRYATAYAVTNDLIDILNEEDAFAFDIADKEMTVDNSVEQKRYMTREKLAEGSEEISGGYYITPEISAKDMHTLGEGTFFAAMN